VNLVVQKQIYSLTIGHPQVNLLLSETDLMQKRLLGKKSWKNASSFVRLVISRKQ